MADLSEGWKDRPPLQWMAQAYLGIGKKEAGDDGEFDAAVAAMSPQG